MKKLYCKCCNRHISRTQWNTHRESKKCRDNHKKHCTEKHREDLEEADLFELIEFICKE